MLTFLSFAGKHSFEPKIRLQLQQLVFKCTDKIILTVKLKQDCDWQVPFVCMVSLF